jgi:hypothetical protein
VCKKKLSPCGAKDNDGNYHNAHVNLHEDELTVAGINIGERVLVKVRDKRITIEQIDD